MSVMETLCLEAYLNSENFFDYSETNSQASLLEPVTEKIPLPDKPLVEISDEYGMSTPDYLVAFSGKSKNYCVGMVDMVDSTKISARLGVNKASRYYQVFLNSMSRILSRFGGFVIKNIGDSLIYYFPESSNPATKYGFMSCIECSIAMIEAQGIICEQLKKEKLPCLDYRVSADYGSVIIMSSSTSDSVDLLGPPVNMCAKINRSAEKNGIAIGGDLYEMVKEFPDKKFKELKGYSVGFKYAYPVYSVKRR